MSIMLCILYKVCPVAQAMRHTLFFTSRVYHLCVQPAYHLMFRNL